MNTLILRRITLISAGLTACSLIASGCSSKSDNTGAGGAAGLAGYPMAGGLGTGGTTTTATTTGMGGVTMATGGTTVVATGGVPVGTGGIVTATGGTTAMGGGAGMGGSTAMGGTTGTGGTTVSVGGQSSASDIKIVGSTTLCMGAMPMIPMTQVSSCSSMTCTGAHCLPMDQIPMGTDITQLAKCPDMTSYCTPDDYIATQGKFLVKTCTSLEGAEGRCISTCIPQVAKQIDQLPKDVCMDSERCAPCYNPIDGTNTHACDQGCDMIKNTTPVTFAKCGIYAMDSSKTPKGLCVPKSLVPMNLQGIPQDTCASDHLCAPIEKVKDLSYNFPTCMPGGAAALLGLMKNMAGQVGGCVPPYLAGSNASLLTADVCTGGDLCAPCTNPLSTPANQPTGACPWP
jgi:hypothetical protein